MRFGLLEYIHTFAPTAQFKCCCDSSGNDTKAFARREEVAQNLRATNAWELFQYLDQNMPQPAGYDGTQKKQFQLTERFHRYVVHEDLMTEEMKIHPKVLKVVPPQGGKDGREIKGIQKIFQMRVTKDLNANDQRKILVRKVACWCSMCVVGSFDNCVCSENSTWVENDLYVVSQPLTIRIPPQYHQPPLTIHIPPP
jgi:hypothetical protein